MSISDAFMELLRSSADIVAATGGRIHSDQIPQNTPLPTIVFYIPREQAINAIDGPSGLDQVIMRVEAAGETRSAADQVRALVRTHIGGFWGESAGILIKEISQRAGRENFTYRPLRGTDRYAWVCRQDWNIFFDAPQSAGSVEQ